MDSSRAQAAVLALLTVLSISPYAFTIGFSGDDWAFLAQLEETRSEGLGTTYGYLTSAQNLAVRPVQVVSMILLHRVFGLDPLGYHIATGLFLVAAAVLMLASLRQLRLTGSIAFVASALFILSPSYATDRFWFASSGYVVTMAFYFLSLLSDLRASRDGTRSVDWRWKSVALGSMAICGLGYEIAIPLLLGDVVLISVMVIRAWASLTNSDRFSQSAAVLASTAVLASVVIFKLVVGAGQARFDDPIANALHLLRAVAVVQGWAFGVALPSAAWWAALHVDLLAGGVALLLGVTIAACAARLRRLDQADPRAESSPWKPFVLGVAALFLGYAVFLTTPRFDAATIGIGNRINMAGAVGVALLLSVALDQIVRRVPSRRRPLLAALLSGSIAFSFALTVEALAGYWERSRIEQTTLLTRIRASLPTPIPDDTTVILAGRCPYLGPAILFEASWDLSSALSLQTGRTLEANVVTPRLTVTPSGLRSTIYSFRDGAYPYGPHLYVYDDRDRSLTSVTDRAVATELLDPESGSAPARVPCPLGREGRGARVLPADSLWWRGS